MSTHSTVWRPSPESPPKARCDFGDHLELSLRIRAARLEAQRLGSGFDEGFEKGDDVVGGADRRVLLERFERHAEEPLHPGGDVGASLGWVVADPGPDLEAVMPVDISIDTNLLDKRRALREATGRTPRRQPAIAEPTGAIEGGVATPTHDKRNAFARDRADLRLLEGENLTVAVDRLAIEEPTNDVELDIGAPTAGCRVDFANLELVSVLPADTHTDRHPSRGVLGERGDLAGSHQWMTTRQEHHAQMQPQAGLHCTQRSEPDRTVDPAAVDETDVIRREDMIDAGVGDRGEGSPLGIRIEPTKIVRRAEADLQVAHPNGLLTVSMLSWPASPAARCTAASFHSGDVDIAHNAARFGYFAMAISSQSSST